MGRGKGIRSCDGKESVTNCSIRGRGEGKKRAEVTETDRRGERGRGLDGKSGGR